MLSGTAASSGSLLQSSDRVQTGYKTASHSLKLYCVTHDDDNLAWLETLRQPANWFHGGLERIVADMRCAQLDVHFSSIPWLTLFGNAR